MGVNKLTWEKINEITDEEISYLLYLEGKSISIIAKIRGQHKNKVEKDIIECRAKYRVFEGTNNVEDLTKKLIKYSRSERKMALEQLLDDDKRKLEDYSINKLFHSDRDECLFYIWILGELESKKSVQKLITFLKCTDGNIKRMCLSALGKIGASESEESLINATYDGRPQVRQYAVKAIYKIGTNKSLERLKEMIGNINEKDYVKRAAVEAIEFIEGVKSGE